MKRYRQWFALGCLAMACGCGPSSSQTKESDLVAVANETDHGHGEDGHGEDGHGEDGHSHDHGDHDHSIAGHSHGAGPHDGTIVDWGGGKFHVEFTVDHEKQQATVYIFGTDEKTPVPISTESIEVSISEPEMLVTLQASPQAQSRHVVSALCKWLLLPQWTNWVLSYASAFSSFGSNQR